MIRLHRLLRLSSLFVAITTATAAHALGVGEVSLNSRLNQPLDAKIALFEAADLDADEVTVRLASPEAFERVGLERPYFLTDLKFSPRLQGAQGDIIVTSSKPVREPYLSFLIEVIWPNGRMLREYTLLLDPPLYAPTQQPAAQQTPRATPAAQTTAVQPARPVTTESAQTTSASVLPTGQYQTQSNDTLWEIANHFGASGSTVHQTMLAIQDLNPQAFINNNINLLKTGQVLRLPDEQQINKRSAAAALRQVAEQNNAWQQSRGLAAQRQINATNREAGNAASRTELADNLRLVSATNEGTSALNERLAAAQESLDSSRRENEDLKSRMSDLEDQLEKLQRLVELKDASLASLQSQLANAAENTANTSDISYLGADMTPAVQEDDVYREPMTEPAEIMDSFDDEPIANNEPPAATDDTPAEPKWWERLLENSMLLWGAGGAALLLLLLLLMRRSRRNARKWAERELEAELETKESKQQTDFAAGLNLPDKTFDDLLPEQPPQQVEEKTLNNLSTAADTDFDALPLVDTAANPALKNSALELDDFADFDLKFAGDATTDKASVALDLPETPKNHEVAAAPQAMPDNNNAYEMEAFDFIAEDESFTEPLDDFVLALDEQAPPANTADEALDELDFAKLDDDIALAPPAALVEPAPSKPTQTQAEVSQASDDDFDFLSGTDETETKLDLARAYIDMGDVEGARDILDEVMSEGSDSQRSQAQDLMTSLAA